jgi:hypothetical protein
MRAPEETPMSTIANLRYFDMAAVTFGGKK